MPIHNADIVAVFDEVADLLELQNANPFRVRAYRNAARRIGALGDDVATLIARNEDLRTIGGIGADLAGKLREIASTGTCALLEQLRSASPPGVTALLDLPGVGPRRVRLLQDLLHVGTLEDLRKAAQAGRVRQLPGFGEKTEARMLAAIDARRKKSARIPLAVAAQYVKPLLDFLRAAPGVDDAVAAGSFRRRRDTVGDLDLLVAASCSAETMQRFTAYEDVEETLASGTTRASVRLRGGIQVDLRVVSPERFGAALVYFTGSKAHNIAVRKIAQNLGLKLNEYGVFRGKRRIAGATERSVYAAVGLPWIPPELREDRGEIAAAREGALPALVTLADLRGDLHAHTTASDGRDTLRDMALAARERGLEYLAITDHSHRLGIAHGLDASRLAQQIDEIDELNETLDGIVLLKGVEVDILADGRLDLADEILSRLDIVVGAVHSLFGLSRDKQTERLLRAMDHPYFSMLAHPTGRLLGERESYDIDLARVIAHASARGCHLELNAQPQRLDLDDTACRQARDAGVLVSIDSDAHSCTELAYLDYGIGQARRGWLRKGDVLNSRTLEQLRALLQKPLPRVRAAADSVPRTVADAHGLTTGTRAPMGDRQPVAPATRRRHRQASNTGRRP